MATNRSLAITFSSMSSIHPKRIIKDIYIRQPTKQMICCECGCPQSCWDCGRDVNKGQVGDEGVHVGVEVGVRAESQVDEQVPKHHNQVGWTGTIQRGEAAGLDPLSIPGIWGYMLYSVIQINRKWFKEKNQQAPSPVCTLYESIQKYLFTCSHACTFVILPSCDELNL